MALLKIVHMGDPVLRRRTEPVKRFDADLKRLIQDMLRTMYAAPGVGLAANQVGLSKQLAVIDVQPDGKPQPLVIINPVIVSKSGSLHEEEGCLSIPGFSAKVFRAERTRVRALNGDGQMMEIEGTGLLSRALQHEIDHLNGKFYIDHVGFFQRFKIKREFARWKRKQRTS